MRGTTKRHPISEAKVICDYFRITHPERVAELKTLIGALEEIEDSYCTVISFHTRSLTYVSPSFQRITGYAIEHTTPGGFEFMLSIIEKSYYPYIMMKQAHYIKKINHARFNFLKPNSMEFDFDMIHQNGDVVPMRLVIVLLEYEPGGDMRTIFVVWLDVRKLSTATLTKKKAMLWNMLKELHRLIFSPGPIVKDSTFGTGLVSLKNPEVNIPKLSGRERELLKLLSKGQSLKQSATSMKVGYTTAETHRKNLFRKFEVTNIAQLIRKASKVFWLE